MDLHGKTEAAVTLHLDEVDDPSRFGVVPTDDSGRVTAFLEKTPDPVTNRINAGCYVFRREVIDQIPAGRRVSVERETFPSLIKAGELLMGYHESAYWLDVGTPQAFVRGSCDLVLGRLPAPAVPGSPGPSLVLAGASVALLLVPAVGSVYPVPSWPVNVFPYIFGAYLMVGIAWIFTVHRRTPGYSAAITRRVYSDHGQPLEDEVEVAALAPQRQAM